MVCKFVFYYCDKALTKDLLGKRGLHYKILELHSIKEEFQVRYSWLEPN